VLLTCADDQKQSLSLRKSDGSVGLSRLSGFPVPRPSCPAGGRRICNFRLMHSSQQVLTIPGGSASAVVPMVRTTPPKEDKVSTSLKEPPRDQALVARLGSKVLDDNLADDDPDLLNFDAPESKIICQMSSWL
jgi:hypothetical protein